MAKKKISVFSLMLSIAVIAIVGIGFSLSRGYLAKSYEVAQQSQAKIALINAYDAEKKFFAKNGRYTDDLVELGVCDLKNEKLFCGLPRQGAYYKIGFSSGESLNRSVDHVLARFPEQANRVQFISSSVATEQRSISLICGDCMADQKRFKIVAFGSIGRGKPDAWTIDQDKKIEHLDLNAQNTEGKSQ